jgi:hypothetical protein
MQLEHLLGYVQADYGGFHLNLLKWRAASRRLEDYSLIMAERGGGPYVVGTVDDRRRREASIPSDQWSNCPHCKRDGVEFSR